MEHVLRESLWGTQLAALEKRRPRTFGGMGARLERTLTLSDIVTQSWTNPCSRECWWGRYGQAIGPIGEGCAGTIVAHIALKGSKTKSMCMVVCCMESG